MLKNLSSLMVYTRDMPKAVAFYRDTLGFKLDMESPLLEPVRPRWRPHPWPAPRDGRHAQPAGGWQPSFTVDDVVATKQQVLRPAPP